MSGQFMKMKWMYCCYELVTSERQSDQFLALTAAAVLRGTHRIQTPMPSPGFSPPTSRWLFSAAPSAGWCHIRPWPWRCSALCRCLCTCRWCTSCPSREKNSNSNITLMSCYCRRIMRLHNGSGGKEYALATATKYQQFAFGSSVTINHLTSRIFTPFDHFLLFNIVLL